MTTMWRMGSLTDPSAYVVQMRELDVDVCWSLMARTRFGRVGLVVDGEPVVRPVNCAVFDREVVFRTADDTTLGRQADGASITLEVDHTDAVAESGWSVIVTGTLWHVTDETELARLAELDLHPWAPGTRDRWMKIVPAEVTGREVTRSRSLTRPGHVPYMPPD